MAIDMAKAELVELNKLTSTEKKTFEELEVETNETHKRLVVKLVNPSKQAQKKKLIDNLAQKDSQIQNLRSKIESLSSQINCIHRIVRDS